MVSRGVRLQWTCWIVLLLACAWSCSRTEPSGMMIKSDAARQSLGASRPAPPPQAADYVRMTAEAPARVGGQGSASPQAVRPAPGVTDRKVIRTGSLTMEVRDIDAAVGAVREAAIAAGGFIASETRHGSDGGDVRTTEIVCRVPADRFEGVVAGWRKLGKEELFQLSAEDITEQYFDLELNLRNQQRLESRLLELLARQTNRLSDLLEIEKELARVRGEIDGLEGKKRFWDNRVAFSSLTVTLHEPRPAIVSAEGGPWRTLVRAFRGAGNNFVLSVAGLIELTGGAIPMLVALVVAIWVLRKVWRRRRG